MHVCVSARGGKGRGCDCLYQIEDPEFALVTVYDKAEEERGVLPVDHARAWHAKPRGRVYKAACSLSPGVDRVEELLHDLLLLRHRLCSRAFRGHRISLCCRWLSHALP